MDALHRLPAGAVLAAAVALLALRGRALTMTGAIAAAAMGSIAVSAGWDWGVILVCYFGTAVLLSHHRSAEKTRRTEGRADKQGPRDALQVAANGSVFAAAALGFAIQHHPAWRMVGAGALAASAADTWATELGTLATARPRDILTLRPVPAGTSGGVTWLGLAAGAAGAVAVALLALVVHWPWPGAVAAMVGGIAGCVCDSVLGASVQERRWCASCEAATEQRQHRCGSATRHVGGWKWLTNDAVNGLATLTGAATGFASWIALHGS